MMSIPRGIEKTRFKARSPLWQLAGCGALMAWCLLGSGFPAAGVYAASPGSPAPPAIPGIRIDDVPASSADYAVVQTIVGRGILSPYSGAAFGGSHAATRYEFAAALYRALKPLIDAMPDAPASDGAFADVPPSDPAAAAVEILHAKGITPGYPNHRFKGRRAVSRYELAQGLYQSLKSVLSEIPVSRPGVRLSDVPPGDPAAAAVNALAARDILPGHDGAFEGNRAASRYELARALYAVLQKLPPPVGLGAATVSASPEKSSPAPTAVTMQRVGATGNATEDHGPDGNLDLAVHPHEIEIDGVVTSVYTGDGKLIVSVTSIKMPDGVITRLAPPREKTVLIDTQTALSPQVNAGNPVSFVAALRGARVMVIGPDQGVGKPLPARLIVASKTG